jgi:WD40 repeat protein
VGCVVQTGRKLLCERTGADATPDGKLIATASVDGIARIWDAESGRLVVQLFGNSKQLYGIGFRKDGKAVITAGEDGIARIWDITTGQQIDQLKGNMDALISAEYSPDGSQIATVAKDSVRLWNSQTNKRSSPDRVGENGLIVAS